MTRWFLPACVAAGALLTNALSATQSPTPPRTPYTAIHDPQFIGAADATFMNDDDRLIGVMSGATAKAYPAGILAQHGLVADQSPKGPIAITW